MHILNVILFIFLKTVYSNSINEDKNAMDAMAIAGHENKEGHASSPSQLLSQLAGKTNKKDLVQNEKSKLIKEGKTGHSNNLRSQF